MNDTGGPAAPRPPLGNVRLGVAWVAMIIGVVAVDLTIGALLSEDPYAAFALLMTLPAMLIAGIFVIWHVVSTLRRWDVHPGHRRRMALPLLVPLLLLLFVVPKVVDRVHDSRLCDQEPTHVDCR